tara:strand:- start:360 stop:593 length:234 start_codon:yes stop_codon:yes gene_type:complete
MAKKVYKLHDEVIGEVARSLQRALLTGTDIVDHLRQLELNVQRGDSSLTLSEDFVRRQSENDQRMIEEAESLDLENE